MSEPRRRTAARAFALAGLLLLALLPVAACDRLPDREPRPTTTPGVPDEPVTGAGLTAAPGPTALPGGVLLASLDMFPTTDEPLEVLITEPSDGTEGTAVEHGKARVVVQFNHPVVPLVGALEAADLPSPLTIEPLASGTGSWLSTSIFELVPDEELAVATRYTVTVAAGLTDVLGGQLAEDHIFSFVTAAPAVVATYPEQSSRFAGATQPVTVTFNTAMDAPSAEAAFRLLPDTSAALDAPVAGSFTWDGPVMRFQPAAPLVPGGRYVATLSGGALAKGGGAATPADYTWRFSVAPPPAVVSTLPRDGAVDSQHVRTGAFEIAFSAPMDPEAVTVSVQPTITHQSTWWSQDETRAHVGGGWLASQAYTVTVAAGSASRYGERLGEDVVTRFTTAPLEPSFRLRTVGPFSMFSAYESQMLYADAVNTDGSELELYTVGRDAFVDQARRRYDISSYRPSSLGLLREWMVDTTAPLDVSRRVSITLAATPEGALEPGAYFVRVPGQSQGHLLIVSRYNLALKHADQEILVWATDLESGQPVPDLPITVYGDNDATIASGTTDADGVFHVDTPARTDVWQTLVAVSEADDRVVAAVISDWRDGIAPYEFNIPWDPQPQAFYANLYTDRPIYRPGQTVYFRGVLRSDDDGRYGLPEGVRAQIVVRDPDGKAVLDSEAEIAELGTFHGEVEISAVAPLGHYNIELRVLPERRDGTRSGPDDEDEDDDALFWANQGFRVSAYRKPEFEVEVTTDAAEYRQDDTVAVDVAATYFFGGPVADAEVRWRLITDDFFFRPDTIEGWWSFIDYDVFEERFYSAQGEVVTEGEATLDAAGQLHLELPADVAEYPLSQVFTVDIEVTDVNHQAVSGRASAVVHKADYYVGLRPQRYVESAGRPVAVDLVAVAPDGSPVAEQAVTVEFSSRQWYSVKEKREDGRFYWTSHFTDTLASTVEVVTDRAGLAVAGFTPATAGSYRAVATATDAAGREVRSATYVWVSGSQFVNWRQENNDRIDLVTDRKTYAPGDVAEVLVPSPFEGAQALVTVERGTIREVRRLVLAGNSETIEIPIRPDYVPNVYVSVVLVSGAGPDRPAELRVGYTNLEVAADEKLLDIQVSTDREGAYGPRDEVTYEITVRDHEGRPVETELSAALVDKALLALTPDTSRSLDQAFYGQRMLGIGTAASLVASADRLNEQLAAEKKGGGGGLTESGTVRRLFRDTAFWNPALRTDRGGQARLEIKLPDNLTTWQLDLRGVTGADTLVGGRRHDTLVTKEMLVRPVTPRFVVVGDRVQLETVINNNADRSVELEVTLATDGLALDGAPSQPLTVPAGGKAKVVWQTHVPATGLRPAAAPGAYGEAEITMSAVGDGFQDAVSLTLPVYQFSGAEVVATAGQVEDEVTELIQLPEEIETAYGDLTVEVNPSLAAASLDSLRWLKSFPYECSEQTVSKFLPNLATWQALDDLGVERPELRANLEAQVAVEIQRLYALQHGDGGWGWWADDESRPWTSAYAMFGLVEADRAGFAVDDDVIERGAEFLINTLNATVDADEGWDLNQRAFIAYVLGRRGGLSDSRAVLLYDRRAGMGLYARAFLALALDQLDGDHATRVSALVADLTGAAELSTTGAQWTEDQTDYRTMSTDTRTSAIALMALARLAPESPLLPPAVRHLMLVREEGHWETTQETAFSVLALTEYMKATGELEGRYRYRVEINDEVWDRGRVDADSVDEPVRLIKPVRELLTDVANELIIGRDGNGELYYSAHLRYHRPAPSLGPLDRGIVVGRQFVAVDPGTLEPTGRPAEDASVGDLVQVKVTLVAPRTLHFVMLEVPLPAGFEAVDTSLRTTSAAASGPQLVETSEDEIPWWRRGWWSYWSKTQLRDDRAALFAERLGRGTYEYTFLMRASVAGQFNVIPARAEEMYNPEVFGRSAGGTFVVTDGQ